MSTTFGVFKHDYEFHLVDDTLPENLFDKKDDFFVVAIQRNGGQVYWHHSIRDVADKLFKEDVRVYPLDNTAQGIYTIGDIKREIKEQETPIDTNE